MQGATHIAHPTVLFQPHGLLAHSQAEGIIRRQSIERGLGDFGVWPPSQQGRDLANPGEDNGRDQARGSDEVGSFAYASDQIHPQRVVANQARNDSHHCNVRRGSPGCGILASRSPGRAFSPKPDGLKSFGTAIARQSCDPCQNGALGWDMGLA